MAPERRFGTATGIGIDDAIRVIHAAGDFAMILDCDQRPARKNHPQPAEDSGGFQADLYWDGSKLVPVINRAPN